MKVEIINTHSGTMTPGRKYHNQDRKLGDQSLSDVHEKMKPSSAESGDSGDQDYDGKGSIKPCWPIRVSLT